MCEDVPSRNKTPSAEVGGERLRQPEFHALGGWEVVEGGATVLGNAVTDHNNSSAASPQKRRGALRTHIRYHSLPTSLLAQPLSAA